MHRFLIGGIGKKAKIIIYVLFLIAMIGNGSTESQDTQKAFQILEQVCQGAFLVLFFLELILFEVESRAEKALDILSILCSFGGLHTQHEISRYFLALRTFKVRFFVKEIPALEEELQKFTSSLKIAANILLPVVLLILIYSIAGLHCFGGNCLII